MGNLWVCGTQPIPVPTGTLTHLPTGQFLCVTAGMGIVKGSLRISFVNVHTIGQYNPIPSSSSLSPSTSARVPTAKTSESITKPIKPHNPKHINTQVDCTESWLQTCDKMRHPQLNTHSMSTDVATRNIMSKLYLDSWKEQDTPGIIRQSNAIHERCRYITECLCHHINTSFKVSRSVLR